MRTLEKALEAFEHMEIKERLLAIYDQVPEGHCSGCTQCCSEAVNTFYSEYLHMTLALKSQGRFEDYRRRAVSFYLTELVKPSACPMLEPDGHCGIYEARPLPCRIYGHLDEKTYMSNQEAVLANNRLAAEAIARQFDFVLPEAVVARTLPFCRQFKSEEGLSADERDDLVDLLFTLESRFLMADLLEAHELNYSLVQWFAYETFGSELAGKLRLQVTEEFIKNGQSDTLLQTLDNIAQK